MLRVPEVEEVLEYGEKLGFNFTRTEAVIVQERIANSLEGLDKFYEMRIEEECLPLRYLTRDPGYRPTEQEDPLNAFIRKCRIAGSGEGLLQGKTVAFKDHVSVAGIPLTFGSHFMDGYIPDFDATIVTRFLDSGATITGKLNLDDFSKGGPTYGIGGDYGRVLNPHQHDCVTGSSSSASAAAVAGGFVDIAIGGDQGGSIRLPSAWCGVVGIKATFGLIPHTGVFGADPSVDYVGPMARSVEDLAAALESIAGADRYDPRQRHIPETPAYTELLKDGVKGLKIGILTEGFDIAGMQKEVRDSVLAAVDELEKAGAIISQISVPMHQSRIPELALSALSSGASKYQYDTNFGGAFAKTWYPTSLITTIGRFKQSHAYELPITMKLNVTLSEYVHNRYHGRLYAKAHNVRKTVTKEYDKAFSEVDLLIMPTVPTTAPLYKVPENYETALKMTLLVNAAPTDPVLIRGKNTRQFNFTGHPAINVPCGKAGGLPIGLQLVARHFDEVTLLRGAYAVQQVVKYEHLSMISKETAPVPV
jgi:amidase